MDIQEKIEPERHYKKQFYVFEGNGLECFGILF